MAFNLELIKTKLSDWLHTVEADLGLGPAAAKLEASLHTVVDQVHDQAVADEATVKNQVIGDVKAIPDGGTPADAEPAVVPAPTETVTAPETPPAA